MTLTPIAERFVVELSLLVFFSILFLIILNETLLELYQNIRILEQLRDSAVLVQSGSRILLEHQDRDQFRTKIPEQNSEKGLEQFWYVK